MDLRDLKEAEDACRKSSDLESWLYNFSVWVWHRIRFVRTHPGFKILETTLTQELVIRLYMASQDHKWRIDMMETTVKDESANGNDLEIIIETKCGFIKMPCQAKLLYAAENYPKIKHTVGDYEQIDLLMDYAQREEGIPIYLLYNCSFDDAQLKRIRSRRKPETYGCSIVEAQYLFDNFYDKKRTPKWQIPKFRDLHPTPAMPFNQILDYASYSCSESILLKQSNIKFYKEDEIINDDRWSVILDQPSKSIATDWYNKKLGLFDEIYFRNTPSFNPMYRIILFLEDM